MRRPAQGKARYRLIPSQAAMPNPDARPDDRYRSLLRSAAKDPLSLMATTGLVPPAAEAPSHPATSRDRRALMDACHHGRCADVETLLMETGVSVNVSSFPGNVTPLMLACMRGHASCAHLLLERGAAVDQLDDDGDTALMRCCRQGYASIAHLLCSYGASRDLLNRHGTSAIDDADETDEALATWLERTFFWCTPLHHLEVITAERALHLLESGADMHARAARVGRAEAPSPVELAKALERDSNAPAGSAAAVLLHWWRMRLCAFAMGTHSRLGEASPVLKLAGLPEVCEMIAAYASAPRAAADEAVTNLGPAMAAVTLD